MMIPRILHAAESRYQNVSKQRAVLVSGPGILWRLPMSQTAPPLQGRGLGQAHAAGDAGRMRGIWRRHRRLWSAAALVAIAAFVLTLMAASYQPLQPGNSGGGSFPGLRTGVGIRWVSQYIPDGSELYVPTQRGSFALAGSVVNRGSFAITVVGVQQPPGSPFSAAGPVRYMTEAQWNLANLTHPPRHLLHDVTLAPGQGIMIGMPLRIAYCADRRSYVGEANFLVIEKFLGFTHVVQVPIFGGDQVVTNAPGDPPGSPGTFCSG